MANNIDQRTVRMNMDSEDFVKQAEGVIQILGVLDSALNAKNSNNIFEKIGNSIKNVDLDSFSRGVGNVTKSFSALETMAAGALLRLGSKIEQVSGKFVSLFTVDPIKDGFREYETQMGSVQTILSNTASRQKELNKEAVQAINEQTAAQTEATKKSNEESLDALKERQEDELKNYKKTSEAEEELIKNQYDEYSDAINDYVKQEKKLLDEQHQEKLDMYEEEYMAKLKAVDEDRYYKTNRRSDKRYKWFN